MTPTSPVTYTLDPAGVGWIVFDDPGSRANVFHQAMLAALAAVIKAVEQAPPRALVLLSAKERIFIAGADLKWLQSLNDPAAAAELSQQGQALFERIALLPCPSVCAIHGACAGGGLELALACNWRLASDAAVTQLGLPETGIGTIPGWGGCVRLPRLIGAEAALEHILRAQLVSAAEARQAGIVHAVVSASELRAQAGRVALALARDGVPSLPSAPVPPPGFFDKRRSAILAKSGRDLPAPLAAVAAVEESLSLPIGPAFAAETRHFAATTVGPVCKCLIRSFFLREAAKKRTLDGWFARSAADPSTLPPVRRVGVIGAGVMGSGIAQWFALRGFEVILREVDPEALARGMRVIGTLCAEAVRRKKISSTAAEDALGRIQRTTGWDGFEQCDLVIEAIIEDLSAKQALFLELTRVVPATTLLASNTSALPIEAIAGPAGTEARTVGIHFFNPVSRMPLVELVLAPATTAAAAARALGVIQALGKSPVICRSSPGFLMTRVLFFYLNEALLLWEKGVETAAIDQALRGFGWPMGPLRLIDEVGIDVTDFILGELAHYFPERFHRATAGTRLLAAGLKGRKNGTGTGFYSYGAGQEAVNDAATRAAAGSAATIRLEPVEIRRRLMRVMADEAQRCLSEGIVHSADEVDFALQSGAGYPAFRAGLLDLAPPGAAPGTLG